MVSWLPASVVAFLTIIFLPPGLDMLRSCGNGIVCERASGLTESGLYCDEFFFGTFFPRMKGNQSGLVKLCQTQEHEHYQGPAVYATLYSMLDRIPVYSASVSQLYPNCSGYSRPVEKYWSRVSLTLCNITSLNYNDIPLPSLLGHGGSLTEKCGKYQALNRDYEGNREELDVDRGHLNPNAINCQDMELQLATFTLTNAAPQFAKFNEIAWEQYECVAEFIILKYAPLERVYIVTGTWGVAKDKDGKPLWMNSNNPDKNKVKIPGYYWKAVCYPGNEWEGKDPWGYAVIHPNIDSAQPSSPENFMKLNEFSSQYFQDNLFGDVCLNADLGPIKDYFDVWEETLVTECGKPVLTCDL